MSSCNTSLAMFSGSIDQRLADLDRGHAFYEHSRDESFDRLHYVCKSSHPRLERDRLELLNRCKAR